MEPRRPNRAGPEADGTFNQPSRSGTVHCHASMRCARSACSGSPRPSCSCCQRCTCTPTPTAFASSESSTVPTRRARVSRRLQGQPVGRGAGGQAGPAAGPSAEHAAAAAAPVSCGSRRPGAAGRCGSRRSGGAAGGRTRACRNAAAAGGSSVLAEARRTREERRSAGDCAWDEEMYENAAGDVHDGGWALGVADGAGVLTYLNGSVTEGTWAEGVLVGRVREVVRGETGRFRGRRALRCLRQPDGGRSRR